MKSSAAGHNPASSIHPDRVRHRGSSVGGKAWLFFVAVGGNYDESLFQNALSACRKPNWLAQFVDLHYLKKELQ